MKHLYRFTPEIILVIYVILFLGFKSPERPWDRVINSDGKGYYAYLPAIFIYHDLQFRFVEQYENQYYPANRSAFKEFRNDAGSRKVNKYFPGMAIVWLPFFLFGHLMAWLEMFPRDGYSLPYQYSIALSALFFLWMGARWLRKLLTESGATEKTAAFLTLAVTLGTNLVFFTVVEPSMTHVYSFALITGFALTTHRFFRDYQPRWFVRSLLLYTLIFLIRPTNGVIILLVPFLAGSNAMLKQAFNRLISDRKTLARGFSQAILLLSVPVILWFLQAGKPLVYTYGEEKLNFFHPQMLNILFSFNRGWFVFTPLAFISLFGLAGLFKTNRYQFWWLSGFLLVFVYVVSCWWVWYYASKCGQRVFIDLYFTLAILLMFLYGSLAAGWLKKLLSGVLVFFICLNLVQFYQHSKWIFPPYNITRDIYFDAFFSLSQKARSYIPPESVAAKITLSNDMESDRGNGWMNPGTRNDTISFRGKWSSKADKKIPYSLGLEHALDTLFTTGNRVIQVRAMILAPREATEGTLVVDFQQDGKSRSYNQFILDKYVPADRWTAVEAAFYVPAGLPAPASVKVYFFNPSALYRLYVDDLSVDFISLKDEPDYRKIEGVLLPEKVN